MARLFIAISEVTDIYIYIYIFPQGGGVFTLIQIMLAGLDGTYLT